MVLSIQCRFLLRLEVIRTITGFELGFGVLSSLVKTWPRFARYKYQTSASAASTAGSTAKPCPAIWEGWR